MKIICWLFIFLSLSTHAVQRNIRLGGMVFKVNVEGKFDGNNAVILLHGFPQTNYMWKKTQKKLKERGIFSIAPQLRGYGARNQAGRTKNYSFEAMAKDVVNIANKLNISNFHVVGHDVGSAVSQFVTAMNPNRVRSMTLLTTPHLKSLGHAVQNDQEQYDAISYMRSFQIPFLPECLFSRNNYARLQAIWTHSSRENIRNYLNDYRMKGVLTGAINSYRANYKRLISNSFELGYFITPTLYIHGKNDEAILSSSHEINHQFFKSYLKEVSLDAGHWLIEEKFEEVSDLIIEHVLSFQSFY